MTLSAAPRPPLPVRTVGSAGYVLRMMALRDSTGHAPDVVGDDVEDMRTFRPSKRARRCQSQQLNEYCPERRRRRDGKPVSEKDVLSCLVAADRALHIHLHRQLECLFSSKPLAHYHALRSRRSHCPQHPPRTVTHGGDLCDETASDVIPAAEEAPQPPVTRPDLDPAVAPGGALPVIQETPAWASVTECVSLSRTGPTSNDLQVSLPIQYCLQNHQRYKRQNSDCVFLRPPSLMSQKYRASITDAAHTKEGRPNTQTDARQRNW